MLLRKGINMDACIVIPARYASSRFPGKPLALLKGATDVSKTLLERSIIAAQLASRNIFPIYVATDDERIATEAKRLSAEVIMTSTNCRNGTERVAEAVAAAGISAEIVVNLQGDAPLTPAHFIHALIDTLSEDESCNMATPFLRCDAETAKNLLTDRREGRVGATTVVFDSNHRALYFSKEVIPFTNGIGIVDGIVPIFHHVGVYAYRRKILESYSDWEIGPLERNEGLEQLRFLENGHSIRMVEVSAPGSAFWELNNPNDVELIEKYLLKMGWD